MARSFEEFGADCRRDGLPLYGRLCELAAADPWLCELLARARSGQARPVLLLAAVHRLVLDRPGAPLARYYPSVTGEPVLAADPKGAFFDFCHQHEGELAALVETRSTQTNEVNRSVAVAAALRVAASDQPDVPIALVELGPSAGLNLLADTYAIQAGDGWHQHPESAVHLATRFVGEGRPDLDSSLPPVVERVGLDLNPVDVRTDVDDLRWLEACLWPEQRDRLARFRAAVEAVRAAPPRLVRGDILDHLPALLAGLAPDAHAVVFHSWVLTYVARDRRPLLATILQEAAADRVISWFSAEGAGVVPGLAGRPDTEGGLTILGLTRFRPQGASTAILGTSHPHLTWLAWAS